MSLSKQGSTRLCSGSWEQRVLRLRAWGNLQILESEECSVKGEKGECVTQIKNKSSKVGCKKVTCAVLRRSASNAWAIESNAEGLKQGNNGSGMSAGQLPNAESAPGKWGHRHCPGWAGVTLGTSPSHPCSGSGLYVRRDFCWRQPHHNSWSFSGWLAGGLQQRLSARPLKSLEVPDMT